MRALKRLFAAQSPTTDGISFSHLLMAERQIVETVPTDLENEAYIMSEWEKARAFLANRGINDVKPLIRAEV